MAENQLASRSLRCETRVGVSPDVKTTTTRHDDVEPSDLAVHLTVSGEYRLSTCDKSEEWALGDMRIPLSLPQLGYLEEAKSRQTIGSEFFELWPISPQDRRQLVDAVLCKTRQAVSLASSLPAGHNLISVGLRVTFSQDYFFDQTI